MTSTTEEEYDFAPGNNWITLRHNGRAFYAPELFYKSPFMHQIVPLRIKDIANAADLVKIYGSSAGMLMKQNIILVNNYPIRYVSVTCRIMGQYVKYPRAHQYDNVDEDDRDNMYFLYLCDSSGSLLTCVVPEYQFIGSGLLTKQDANIGVLVRIIGSIKYVFAGTGVADTKRQKELHPLDIVIMAKKATKSMFVELNEWKKTIEFRDKHLSSPWQINNLPIPDRSNEAYIDINNLSIKNNVLVCKSGYAEQLSKSKLEHLKLSSFCINETQLINAVNDSILLNKQHHFEKHGLPVGSIFQVCKSDNEVEEINSMKSASVHEAWNDSCQNLETNKTQPVQLLPLPGARREVIDVGESIDEDSEDDDSEIQEIQAEDFNNSHKNIESFGHVKNVDDIVINSNNDPKIEQVEKVKEYVLVPDVDDVDDVDVTNGWNAPTNDYSLYIDSSLQSQMNSTLTSTFDSNIGLSGLSLPDLQSILRITNLNSLLKANLQFAKLIIFDRNNIINKLNYSVEFVKMFLNIGASSMQSSDEKGLENNKLKGLMGRNSVNLRDVYQDLILSNFLSLLVLKYYFAVRYTLEGNQTVSASDSVLTAFTGPQDFLQFFSQLPRGCYQRYHDKSRETTFIKFLSKLQKREIIKLVNSFDFNLYKSKLFHNVRHEFTDKMLLKGYKFEELKNYSLLGFKKTPNSQKVFINYDTLCNINNHIIKELKRCMRAGYTHYFDQLKKVLRSVIREEHSRSYSNTSLKKDDFIVKKLLLINDIKSKMAVYNVYLNTMDIKKHLQANLRTSLDLTIEPTGHLLAGLSANDDLCYILDKIIEHIIETNVLKQYDNELINVFFKQALLQYTRSESVSTAYNGKNALLLLLRVEELKSAVGFKPLEWVYINSKWVLQLKS